jgi:hypothetical protein
MVAAAPSGSDAPSVGPAGSTASSVPAPAKKSGNGCLKAFFIVAVAFFLIGTGLFVVVGFVLDRAVDQFSKGFDSEAQAESKTGIASYPLGFDTKHPPQLDVYKRPVTCSTDASTNTTVATGSVKNHSGHPSSYLITVEFRRDGSDVGGGLAAAYRVEPGQVVAWRTVGGETSSASGALTCVVTLILRSDNPNVVPSTTTTVTH